MSLPLVKRTKMSKDPVQDFHLSQHPGALQQPLLQIEAVHAFQIERQADETPFASGRLQAAQGELAKAEDFFDDANHGFHGAFPQAIDCSSDLGLEFVSHLHSGAGLLCRWFRLLLEKGVPIEMMGFASGGDIGLNPQIFAILNVDLREVAVVHSHCFGFSDFSRQSVQGGQSFLFVVRMVRKGLGDDQQAVLIGSHLHIVVLVKAIIGAVFHTAPAVGAGVMRESGSVKLY